MFSLTLAPCVVVLMLAVVSVTPLKLPSYLKACGRNDPKLNECATKQGRNAIPHIINGDRKYKVPSMNPLEIVELQINQGTSQVGLKIILKNAKLYGLKDTIVDAINLDMVNQTATWLMKIPKLELLSDYNVTGKVLLLPIFGAGKANVTLENVRFKYDYNFTIYEKNGKEYTKPHKGIMNYELDRAYLKLENLFNGDKLLGTQMNKFLNENWQDASRELGPSMAEAVSRLIDSILSNISDTVPYNDLFLP